MSTQTVSTPSTIRITPIKPALGARIEGIQINPDLGAAEFQLLRDALHRYSVIVLANQQIEPQSLVDFAALLGPLRGKSTMNRFALPGVPDVTVISNIWENGREIGMSDAGLMWHTDLSYSPTPDMYSMLQAITIPVKDGKVLGNTSYTSVAAAFDALPDAMKSRMMSMKAVHSYAYHMEKKRVEGHLTRPPLTKEEMAALPDSRHPLIRTHPITGRKCIYASEGHTSHLEGLPEAEATELFAEIRAHLAKPEFVYHHSWTLGDVVVWDNCAVQHLAHKDYGDIPRLMYQAGVAGIAPV